jgi:hypothetical protein
VLLKSHSFKTTTRIVISTFLQVAIAERTLAWSGRLFRLTCCYYACVITYKRACASEILGLQVRRTTTLVSPKHALVTISYAGYVRACLHDPTVTQVVLKYGFSQFTSKQRDLLSAVLEDTRSVHEGSKVYLGGHWIVMVQPQSPRLKTFW